MNYLIITDSHYGWKKANTLDLDVTVSLADNILLKNGEKFDKVILLGDTFDLWRRSMDILFMEQSKNFSYVLDNLDDDLIYVIGNHDFALYKMLCNQYEYCIKTYVDDKSNIVFNHGYLYDVIYEFSPLGVKDYEDFALEMCYTKETIKDVLKSLWNTYIRMKLSNHGHKRKDDELWYILNYALVYEGKNVVIGHFHRYNSAYFKSKTAVSLLPHCKGYVYMLSTSGEMPLYEINLYKRTCKITTVLH